MNRVGRGWAVVLTLALVAGCTHLSVWQSSDPITPSSYRSSDPRVVRTVGKLRRLAALPPRALVSGKEETPSGDPLDVRRLLSEKDYEVIRIDLYADISPEKFGMSAVELDAALDGIRQWAWTAPEESLPPPEVAAAISRIGRSLGADGLLAVRTEFGRRSRAWVDIMEVASGRSVWRLRFDGPLTTLREVQAALTRLEPAIPSAVIEGRGSAGGPAKR